MPSGVTFGAIRWDAWWDLSTNAPARSTRASLSDSAFQFRAPIHSQVLAPNRITFETTQAKFDDEITFAAANGLHYWAYLLYQDGNVMNAGLNFHLASSIAATQKFCLLIQTNVIGSTGNFTSAIDNIITKYFTKSYYFTLPSGKPLVYIYYSASDVTGYWGGSNANLKAAIDYLIAQITATKGVAPYVVIMCGASNATRTALGGDAITNYIGNFSARVDGTYAQLDTDVRAYWASLSAAVAGSGAHSVPICMMGWNTTPRKRRPVTWEVSSRVPEQGMRAVYALPTNSEAAVHVQAAVDYVLANPSRCPEKTILCYAWNENDEGGWLNKTIGDPTGARLAAIASVIA